MPPRIMVIANPVAGRGRGARALEWLRNLLTARGLSAQVLTTERSGHAGELAQRAAAAQAELLLVLGGDGTLRDVAEGLAAAGRLSSISVALLPSGTGNDLARALGIPSALPDALNAALSGHDYPLDLWMWDDRLFLNVAGVGLDAAVAGKVNREFRHLRGTAAYLAGFLSTFPTYQPFSLSLQWSESGSSAEWRGNAWLAAFGNGTCYGGGMHITPAALANDGLLDVVVVEDISRGELLRQFPGIFAGTHVRHPRVRSFRVSEVRVETTGHEATLDGELLGRTPAVITRLTERLRLRLPPPKDG